MVVLRFWQVQLTQGLGHTLAPANAGAFSDGERETEIVISGKTAEVTLAGSTQSCHVLNGWELKRMNIREPFRNGELDAAYVELKGKQARFVIKLGGRA